MQDRGAAEAARHGATRSEHWPTVEHEFKHNHPDCAAGGPGPIQVHHVNPFHYVTHPKIGRPDLELDERNLIGLTEREHGDTSPDYHELIGHLGNFKLGNLAVRDDAVTYKLMSDEAIKADAAWQSEEKNGRLKPLDEFTEDDFQSFRDRLNQELPPDPAVLQRFGITLPEI